MDSDGLGSANESFNRGPSGPFALSGGILAHRGEAPPLAGARASKSADGARRLQIRRELALSPRERVIRALDLGRTLKAFERPVKR